MGALPGWLGGGTRRFFALGPVQDINGFGKIIDPGLIDKAIKAIFERRLRGGFTEPLLDLLVLSELLMPDVVANKPARRYNA